MPISEAFLKGDGVGSGVERKGGTSGEGCIVLKSPQRQPIEIFLKTAALKMEK